MSFTEYLDYNLLGIILRHSAPVPKSRTSPRFPILPLILLLGISTFGAATAPPGGIMPIKPCRTFTSLSDFRNFTSPASPKAPGERSGPERHGASNGAEAIPLWRVELLRRPLRRVVRWATYTIPAERKFRLPACEMYRETLECGHKTNRFMTWDPPAKRRRCRECAR